VHTRRGDLESLMYNGLEWLKLKLPWKNLTLPKTIKSKNEMKDAILTAGPNKKIYDYNKVPNCKYYTFFLMKKQQNKFTLNIFISKHYIKLYLFVVCQYINAWENVS